MRIVLVDPRSDSAPYDDGLADALARRGHDVTIATSRFRHAVRERPPTVRVAERFYRLADRLPGRLRTLARGVEHVPDVLALALELRRQRVDVIHVQWLVLPADARLWRLVRRIARAPIVLTAHNAARSGAHGNERLAGDARRFDAVIAHSAAGARALVELGLEPGRVHRVRHGVLTAYAGLEPTPPAGVPAGLPVAAFLGLLRPYKGLADLLDAWPAVRARAPGAVLHVAGRPFGEPAAARARRMAAQGVVADLRFLGEAELAGALERAAIVVLPYRTSDQSGILFAALACGTPVVVTDVGGFREVIDETRAGVVVPPNDPVALAEAVAWLLGDEILRDGYAAAARAAAAGPYGWDAIAGETEAIYRGVGAGA